MKRSNDGFAMIGIALTAIFLGAAAVVMSLADQSRMTRMTHATLTRGRHLTQLAQSAIDEALADFAAITAEATAGHDMRSYLAGVSRGGAVPSGKVFVGGRLQYSPARTRALAEEAGTTPTISPVTLRALYYDTLQNYGEVEISCVASSDPGSRQEISRRVTMQFYFQLDVDGRSFVVNPVATRSLLDRSRLP